MFSGSRYLQNTAGAPLMVERWGKWREEGGRSDGRREGFEVGGGGGAEEEGGGRRKDKRGREEVGRREK
jgi:hypothetical protein